MKGQSCATEIVPVLRQSVPWLAVVQEEAQASEQQAAQCVLFEAMRQTIFGMGVQQEK